MNLIKKLLNKLKRKNKPTNEQLHKIKLEKIAYQLEQEKRKLITLLPEQFKFDFNESSYISGGCIYSLYHDNKPKDYDFFVASEELVDRLKKYFIDQCGYHGNGMSGGAYKNYPLLVTDNAISIGKYQIITRWIGEPEEVISEFDFRHNQFYYRNNEIKGLCDFKYLQGIDLIYNKERARDIVGTIIRVPKFVKRGMNIRCDEMAKMLLKLHEVGFNERELEILNDANSVKNFGS